MVIFETINERGKPHVFRLPRIVEEYKKNEFVTIILSGPPNLLLKRVNHVINIIGVNSLRLGALQN